MKIYYPHFRYSTSADDELYYGGSDGVKCATKELAIKAAETEMNNWDPYGDHPISYSIIEEEIIEDEASLPKHENGLSYEEFVKLQEELYPEEPYYDPYDDMDTDDYDEWMGISKEEDQESSESEPIESEDTNPSEEISENQEEHDDLDDKTDEELIDMINSSINEILNEDNN